MNSENRKVKIQQLSRDMERLMKKKSVAFEEIERFSQDLDSILNHLLPKNDPALFE